MTRLRDEQPKWMYIHVGKRGGKDEHKFKIRVSRIGESE